MNSNDSENLCLACGFCCSGVLFKDVELQSGDSAAALKSLGLPVKSRRGKELFAQPCAALSGCTCRIYADRPVRCRQFDCALLLAVVSGEIGLAAALRVVREARQRSDKVLDLLRELGDEEEGRALSLRFRRMKRQFERGTPDDDTAEVFGDLTLAVHDLNQILCAKFYPDPAD